MAEKIRDIINKGKAIDCNLHDQQEMLSLFHLPEKEFEVKEKLFDDLSSAEELNISSPNLDITFTKIWKKIEQSHNKNTSKIISLRSVLKIAAAIVIGLIMGISYTYIKPATKQTLYYAAHSPKGSVSEMLLPDGTVIFLNADSHIKYSVDGKKGNREVFLDGEAWFDVKKNKRKPFIVHTSYYDVKVTGTQFNIKAYGEDKELATTLENGQIIIQSTENFRMAQNIIVTPGEQVVLNKDSKELTIKDVNTKWYTSWKDNKLIFVNMNLRDLMVLMERKYGVDIEVRNKNILDLHFDGTIKNESIIEFMEIIQETLPINYKIVGQKIIITENKN